MKPALLSFPHISSYSVLLLAAFLFGWLLGRRRSGQFGIARAHIDNIALLLPVAGLVGARLFARLFYEKAPFAEAIRVWKGDGLVFYGGFLACLAAIGIYAAIRSVNLIRLADCLAPSFLLGLALGRVGCFMAGCCWGDICVNDDRLAGVSDPVRLAQVRTIPSLSKDSWPLAVSFPSKSEAARQHAKLGLIQPGERSLPVHPVQLYEAAAAFALALLLHGASRRQTGLWSGATALAASLGYAWLRYCTELLRADNKLYAGDFTFSQVVSLWIAATCLAILAARAVISPRSRARAEAIPYRPHPASG